MNRTKLRKTKVGSDSVAAGVFCGRMLKRRANLRWAKSGYISPVAVYYATFMIDSPASLSGFISFNLVHQVRAFFKISVCLLWFLSGTRRAEKYLLLLHLSKSAGGKHVSPFIISFPQWCILFVFSFYTCGLPLFSLKDWWFEPHGYCCDEQAVPCKINSVWMWVWMLIQSKIFHYCQL